MKYPAKSFKEAKNDVRLWKTFGECFNCFYFSALIDENILYMQEGLFHDLQNLEQIRNMSLIMDFYVICYGLVFIEMWKDGKKMMLLGLITLQSILKSMIMIMILYTQLSRYT